MASLGVVSLLAPSLVHAAGGYFYVANFAGGTVSVINSLTNVVDATISVGGNPDGVAVSGTGVFVTNYGNDNVSVIDATTQTVERTITVGDGPRGIAVSGTGVFVTNQGGDTVSVIDTTTQTVERTINVGDGARAVAVSGTGAFVANELAATVSVIDTTTLSVDKTISVDGQPRAVAISGTGAYVANGASDNVSVIDISTNMVDMTINVGDAPEGIAASGTGVFVANNNGDSVSVIDTTTHTVDATITVGGNPYAIAFDGTGAYVTNYSGDTVSVIDKSRNTLVDTIAVGATPFGIAFSEDTVTLEPTLTIPDSVAGCPPSLHVQYSLPEAPLAGTVLMSFYNHDTHMGPLITLTDEASADFYLNVQDMGASDHVASVFELNAAADGEYTVYFYYQDAFGNASASVDMPLTIVTQGCESSSSSSEESSEGGGGGGGGGRRGSGTMPARSSSSSSNSSSRASSSSSSSAATPCDLGEGTEPFKDVLATDWFCTHVKSVLQLKIFEGYKNADGTPKGTFGPADSITLGQLAKVGTILRNKKDLDPKPTGDNWFAPYMDVMHGLSFTSFRGADPLAFATRSDVIATIFEALNFSYTYQESVPPYTDVSMDDPNIAYIGTGTKMGIISGDIDGKGNPTGTFRPNDPVNRAEVVKMIDLALAYAKSSSSPSGPVHPTVSCVRTPRTGSRTLNGGCTTNAGQEVRVKVKDSGSR